MPKRNRPMEIENTADLQTLLDSTRDASHCAIRGVDFHEISRIEESNFQQAILLGCLFKNPDQEDLLRAKGAAIFPRFEGLPYNPYRKHLYTVEELLDGYSKGGYTGTADFAIYAHSHKARHGKDRIPIKEALAQRIHDHAIDDALFEFLADSQNRGIVGVMGGHGTKRSDPFFKKVALLCWHLTRKGYLVVSGGGPGTMEAANLGAWLSNLDDPQVIDKAIHKLKEADLFSGGKKEGDTEYLAAIEHYIACAKDVVDGFSFPDFKPGTSIAIPTWFYGHEPSNLFSTYVAKYFANSIREEGLLAIATSGVVYAPGSAGTTQEIFQDLTQNHYATYVWRSPMIFLGSERYSQEHQLIKNFIESKGMATVYGDLVMMFDEVDDIVKFIETHPPRKAPSHPPLYELANEPHQKGQK